MLGAMIIALLGAAVAAYGLLLRRRAVRGGDSTSRPATRLVAAGSVLSLAAIASMFFIEGEPPVRYKVWHMQPLTCSNFTLPDTLLIRTCLDSSSFRGRAGPLLRAAVDQGIDSAAVARLAVSAAQEAYRRGVATKALHEFREAVELAQFADSVEATANARFHATAAAYQAALLLKDADDCPSVRDAVRYLEIVFRYPIRNDPGIEPDTMRLAREAQAELARTRARAVRICSSSTRAADGQTVNRKTD
jgi:hypothetical protein